MGGDCDTTAAIAGGIAEAYYGVPEEILAVAKKFLTEIERWKRCNMVDVLTPEQRRKNMQHIKGKDTSIELKLRKTLWEAGYRYRKNYKKLPGKPDIVFTKYKIAVFCDSEFFHGKDWEELKEHLKYSNNSKFRIDKISKNIDRDQKVNRELENMGWTVIRFWGNEIKKDVDGCVKRIGHTILEKLQSQ